jgi:hypothetical protein
MTFNYITLILLICVILASVIIICLLNAFIGWISSAACGFITRKLGKRWECAGEEQKKSRIARFFLVALTFCISLQPILFCIGDTLLNRTFVEDEIARLDVNSAIVEILINPDFPYSQYTIPALEEAAANHSELIETQVIGAVDGLFDYIDNNVPLEIDITLEVLKADFSKELIEAVIANPPAELANATPEALQVYADAAYEYVSGNIDDTYLLSASNATVIRVINAIFNVYQVARSILIPVTVILAILIIVLNRKVYPSLIDIGSALFIAGPLGYLYGLILAYMASMAINKSTLNSIQIWLVEVVRDAWSVANAPTYILCGLGIFLVIIAVILPRKKQEAMEATEDVRC